MKPLKRSVSLVIETAAGMLLVRRPEGDESLPGVWGLPAASLRAGESEEEALKRAGREKLGVELDLVELVGEAEGERPDYRIAMRDWSARIAAGQLSVPQPGGGTQYVDWRWGDPAELVPAAQAGSLCARVLLRERELAW